MTDPTSAPDPSDQPTRTPHSTTTRVVAVVVALALVAGAGAVVIGLITGGGDVEERGVCSPSATYEMSVEEDDGATEVSFELQSAAPGETWQVTISQGDEPILGGERITDEDAEIDVDAVAGDGSDAFTVLAVSGDQSCTATLSR